jgi:hypothetical protein
MRQRPAAKTKLSVAILFGVYMVDGRFILDTNDFTYKINIITFVNLPYKLKYKILDYCANGCILLNI